MNKFLIVALAFAAFTGCGDDETPDWVVEITASDRTLPASGVEGSNITVGVYDAANGDAPAPQGITVIMQCRDDGGEPTGSFAESATIGEASSLTDTVGLVEFRLSCGQDSGEDYTINCLAISQGSTSVLIPQITCETGS